MISDKWKAEIHSHLETYYNFTPEMKKRLEKSRSECIDIEIKYLD